MVLLKFWIVGVLLLVSCARLPVKTADKAMRKSQHPPALLFLSDDLGLDQLKQALRRHIDFFKKNLRTQPLQKEEAFLQFGPKKISKSFYFKKLEELYQSLLQSSDAFYQKLQSDFEVYEVYGGDHWGEVLVTSYYEPVLEVSEHRTDRFFQPIYRTPDDLVSIDLGEFAARFPLLDSIKERVIEQKSRERILRGRLIISEKKVVPYFERAEIDSLFPPIPSRYILAWADPIEAFFLQIQGSGVLKFPSGKKIRVGYDAQNGYPYYPIGRALKDVIPLEEMSLQKIERHLRSLPYEQMQAILNQNKSYVFFKKLKGKALTFSGAPIEDGRSIASDYQFFPKGALGFLIFQKPIFSREKGEENDLPDGWETVGRFVFDHDTGGAIRGTGHVDLYWGEGKKAKQVAGVMKKKGFLYYLVPRSDESDENDPSMTKKVVF